MRLWHYRLIPFLPKSQLVAQWRELNSIFKKRDKHILINYVYEYPTEDLYYYTSLVICELERRNIKIKKWKHYENYFGEPMDIPFYMHPFKYHHNDRYLIQCFYNLQEKYDRGQKDFDKREYQMLEEFVEGELRQWKSTNKELERA